MSRHVFPGIDPGHMVAIGWDRPLETFFVQVLRPDRAQDGEVETILWKGGDLRELPNAADAIAVARPWADLPADLGAILETDRLKTAGRCDGAHQRDAKRRLFGD